MGGNAARVHSVFDSVEAENATLPHGCYAGSPPCGNCQSRWQRPNSYGLTAGTTPVTRGPAAMPTCLPGWQGLQAEPAAATRRICQRAWRNLK